MGLLAEQFDQPRRLSDSFGPPEGPVNMQGIADYLDKYAEREEMFRIPEEDTYFKWKRREAPPEETAIGIAGGMKGNEDVYSQRVDENDRAAWLTGTGDLGAGTYDSFGDFTDYLGDTFGSGVLGFLGDDEPRNLMPIIADDIGPSGIGLGGRMLGLGIGGLPGMGLGLLSQGIDRKGQIDDYNTLLNTWGDRLEVPVEQLGFWDSIFKSGDLREQAGDEWARIREVALRNQDWNQIAPQQELRALLEGPANIAPAPVAVVDRAPVMVDSDDDRNVREAFQRAADLQATIRRDDLQEAIRREDAWGGGSTSSQAMRERSGW